MQGLNRANGWGDDLNSRMPDVQSDCELNLRTALAESDTHTFGVLLCDQNLQPMGSDMGALTILRQYASSRNGGEELPPVPEELRVPIASEDRGTSVIRLGQQQYRCRFYSIALTCSSLTQALVVVHFEADRSDPIERIVAAYRLTEREQEALRGIARGFTTKELAERMHISPNTVKSFIRLISVKMGVSSRAEIMGCLLKTSRGL